MKYREIIADISAKQDSAWARSQRSAHGYGKRFIVWAEELLTAFVEVERAIHEFAVGLIE